jgi:hypothetical protein
MIKAAKFYAAAGYSVIAVSDNKRAILPWKRYQSEIISDPDIRIQFNHPKCSGIAVICGQVSGNLEVIDVDLKYDLSGTLWERFVSEIQAILPLLYQVRTKSGGIHLYYKCETIEGNQKLARRPASPEELKNNPNVKEIVLIETRGEGGYVIAPPSPGYEKVSEDFNVPVLSVNQRDHLLTAARSFDLITIEQPTAHPPTTSPGITPWDDYNKRCDVVKLLQSHGWTFIETKGPRDFLRRPGQTDQYISADYNRELNLFKVFSSSTQFELGKGYKPFAILATLEHGGDYSACAKRLLQDGYGNKDGIDPATARAVKSIGMNIPKEQITSTLISEGGISKKQADKIYKEATDLAGPEILTFWEVIHTKTNVKINIVRHKFIEFLYNNGFHLFFYDKLAQSYRIVQQRDGFVQDVSIETIKKFVKDYILSLPPHFDSITPEELLEVIMKGSDTYFGKGLIEFINAKELKVLKDDHDTAYFAFRNCVIKISAAAIEAVPYGQIHNPVWRSQVIDVDIDIDNDFDPNLCEFYSFLRKIANGDNGGNNDEYLTSLIGYLLHRYKDPSRPFAVILAEETEDEKKGGGTGKGILVKALSYMANLERVDGKNFKLDKSFAFQRVDLDTKIVAIEDMRKQVDFEGFYAIITEGMTIEKKNKDEYFIPYKDSPKIIFTTNYTIAGNGGHGKRRQKIFEFTNHFHQGHTPIDEYGHKLFDDWDPDEWNRFYNLMFLCVQDYLIGGIKVVENSTKIQRKHLRLAYTPEFLDWFDEYVKVEETGIFGSENGSEGRHASDKLDSNQFDTNEKTTQKSEASTFTPFKTLYTSFLISNDLEKRDYSQKRFRSAIAEACERLNYSFSIRRQGYERHVEYKVTRSLSNLQSDEPVTTD